MFTCMIDCDIDYEPKPNDGRGLPRTYCALTVKDKCFPSGLAGGDNWLCPKAFYRYFHENVVKALTKPKLRSVSRMLSMYKKAYSVCTKRRTVYAF